jgi:hypothetical protein
MIKMYFIIERTTLYQFLNERSKHLYCTVHGFVFLLAVALKLEDPEAAKASPIPMLRLKPRSSCSTRSSCTASYISDPGQPE